MHISQILVLVVASIIIIGMLVFADNNSSVEKNATTNVLNNTSVCNGVTSDQVSILVKFNPELWNSTVLQTAVNASHASIGAVVLDDYSQKGMPGLQLVLLPAGMSATDGISYYKSLPYVIYAEPNSEYSIASTANKTVNTGVKNASVPDKNLTVINNGRLLVQFNASAFNDTVKMENYASSVHSSLNTTVLNDYSKEGLSGLFLVSLPKNMNESEGISMYKNQSNVVFAEPDYNVSA